MAVEDMDTTAIDFNDLQEGNAYNLDDAETHPQTAQILQELDRRTSARRIAVPTKDAEVRLRLREIDEPITLFGERPEDRRDRLRLLWSKMREAKEGEGGKEASDGESSDSGIEEGEKEEEFYTEGTEALSQCRRGIADYSLARYKPSIQSPLRVLGRELILCWSTERRNGWNVNGLKLNYR